MEQLLKNKFWITCGALSLVMIAFWFWRASYVAQIQADNEMAIDMHAKEAEEVKTTTAVLEKAPDTVKAHPNAGSVEGMKQEIDAAAKAMLEAWEIRRAAQEGILKWPDDILETPEFAAQFSKFDPPEKYPVFGADGKPVIPPFNELLQIYQRQIPARMEKIAGIIKSNWKFAPPAATTSGTGAPQGKERPKVAGTHDMELATVVKWNPVNQELWNQKLTDFKDRDGNGDTIPTSRQAFALQQDLWLLEACFNVFKKVNGDAETNEMAAIKEIVHVVFGREARALLGEIAEPKPSLLSGQTMVENTEERKMRTKDDVMTDSALNVASDSAVTGPFDDTLSDDKLQLAPFNGRYVGVNLEPIKIEDIQLVLNSPMLIDNNIESIVARRVPFRIALRMNETKIPDLIAAFSNSEFAFEIFQVRVNREDTYGKIEIISQKAKASSGARDRPTVAGAGGASGGQAARDDAAGGEEPGSTNTGPVAKGNIEARRNYDVNVEFIGIVKIYNPVDRTKFKSNVQPAGNAAPPAAAQANTVSPSKS